MQILPDTSLLRTIDGRRSCVCRKEKRTFRSWMPEIGDRTATNWSVAVMNANTANGGFRLSLSNNRHSAFPPHKYSSPLNIFTRKGDIFFNRF